LTDQASKWKKKDLRSAPSLSEGRKLSSPCALV
jgi:hypothetical protein